MAYRRGGGRLHRLLLSLLPMRVPAQSVCHLCLVSSRPQYSLARLLPFLGKASSAKHRLSRNHQPLTIRLCFDCVEEEERRR
ncbi:Protein CBG25472 [Caenorhabditis briggsae]|uniref:Protein CBG25472 n=1 Tax=Caenorhabditis briggsae TaxID=6238 RepID=B6IFI6_CAEBR|nr:Protein CBG25472 [Caenorhabditis briggsae]CAR98666.1 Protein CBG25472 [Caenorhabditis briggsae]